MKLRSLGLGCGSFAQYIVILPLSVGRLRIMTVMMLAVLPLMRVLSGARTVPQIALNDRVDIVFRDIVCLVICIASPGKNRLARVLDLAYILWSSK